MREACECTFMGKSNQSLLSIYKSEHSPVRTQLFWIKLENIPLFVATHLIRHHVGVVPFQLTCRPDRKGGNTNFKGRINEVVKTIQSINDNFAKGSRYTSEDAESFNRAVSTLEWTTENTDRETPVNLGLCVNAQALIDMAKVRMCYQASPETRMVFESIRKEVSDVDKSLTEMMVCKCIYRNGLCGEPNCCGFNHTPAFKVMLDNYLMNFTNKQRGITT